MRPRAIRRWAGRFPRWAGIAGLAGVVGDDPAQALKSADVLIDFTAPVATLRAPGRRGRRGQGLRHRHHWLKRGPEKRADRPGPKDAGGSYAPNMSVGMNLMFKLTALMAKSLGPDYALELVEAHHDQKVDAPSGTAVKLIEQMANARGLDPAQAAIHGRQGMVGPRTKDEIGVSVIRGGDIVGDHTLYFIGQGRAPGADPQGAFQGHLCPGGGAGRLVG